MRLVQIAAFAVGTAGLTLAGCAEGPYLQTKFETVQTNRSGTICFTERSGSDVRQQVRELASKTCWDVGYRRALMASLEYRYQCSWTAPTEISFVCLDANPTPPDDPLRRKQWEQDRKILETRPQDLLPPPAGY